MDVIFLSSFLRDIKKLSDPNLKNKIKVFIQELEEADALENSKNAKRLKGFLTAYRWPCGDYRLGFYYDNNKVELARLVKRNDIYKVFPSHPR
jgi:mRNA interferase RelE/StbE